jgi:hypothetical protein
MKKALLIVIASLALSVGAFAQRYSVPYAGVGLATNFRSADEGMTGPALTIGFRNYNRHSFISFAAGAEVLGYYIPSRTASAFGVFGIPEIGVAIGPSIFKVYPHSGFMLGYDSIDKAFGWGGKEGVAFEFGRHVTIDFSTYVPKFNFNEALYAINFIWRFF